MSLRLLACAALLIAASIPAEAGVFSSKKKLPTPIRYTSNRVERSGPQTGIVRHPPKRYSKPSWGSRFDLARDNYPAKPLTPFLLHQQR